MPSALLAEFDPKTHGKNESVITVYWILFFRQNILFQGLIPSDLSENKSNLCGAAECVSEWVA